MRIATLVPRISLTSTLTDRNRKRLRLAAFIGLIAFVGGGAIASASSARLRALLLGGARAEGGSVSAPDLSQSKNTLALQNKSNAALASASAVSESQLNKKRRGHTATLLSDGKVLIVGGENQNGFVTEAEIYDPLTQTFS